MPSALPTADVVESSVFPFLAAVPRARSYRFAATKDDPARAQPGSLAEPVCPDRWDTTGALVCLVGVATFMYVPRRH